MKKIIQRCLLMILSLSMLFSTYSKAAENDLTAMMDSTAKSLQKCFDSKEKSILSDEQILPAGSSSSDWIAMTLAFAKSTDAYKDYLERLEDYVKAQYEKQGYLDAVKATEYHRIALTMLALGGNPEKLITDQTTINLIADGTWNFYGGFPSEQGSNGLIYALLLLEAREDFVPADKKIFKTELINELLTYQDAEGGYALNASFGADMDMTAMAVQALAPYQNQPKVKNATDKALLWICDRISTAQTSEAVAQTILALCALGIDPEKSKEFMQGERTLLEQLNHFRTEDEMYCHELSDEASNLVSTYQSLLALEAVNKLRTEHTWIFDFEDYTFSENLNAAKSSVIPVIIGAGASVLIAILILSKKRKKCLEEG